MGKKKRGRPDVEEILSRPWCYYCERDFDDQKVLINHQKAKHFKCERCGRRLNTAGGLSVHMSQVHKETLSAVDNALPNRAGLDIEIFGMEGIPEDVIQQHSQRILTQFHQAEAERRVDMGGQGSGSTAGAAGNMPKKPKFESPSDLKKRLAEHKAKLAAAEQANGGTSGAGTPSGAGTLQSSASVTSPRYPQHQPQQPQQFNGVPGNPFHPGYGPSAPGTLPQQSGGPLPHNPSFSSPPFLEQGADGSTQFPPPLMQPGHAYFQGGPPGAAMAGPSRPFGAGSPVHQHGFQQQPPPLQNASPQGGQSLQRTSSGSSSPAPGLPQRPAFGAPHVNHFQMQKMHQGQVPGLPNPPSAQSVSGSGVQQTNLAQPVNLPSYNGQLPPGNETSLDELIAGASKQAVETTARGTTVETSQPAENPVTSLPQKSAGESVAEKKDKKDKSKAARLVYTDQDVSPEEKMANMPRYAFTPAQVR